VVFAELLFLNFKSQDNSITRWSSYEKM